MQQYWQASSSRKVPEYVRDCLQGRLVQELNLELEASEHRTELQVAELQQRLRLSEEASAAARGDVGRLKQEQNEDARLMEVGWRQPYMPNCDSNMSRQWRAELPWPCLVSLTASCYMHAV